MKRTEHYSAKCTAAVRAGSVVILYDVDVSGNYPNDSVAKVKLTWKLQGKAKKTWKRDLMLTKHAKFFYDGVEFK